MGSARQTGRVRTRLSLVGIALAVALVAGGCGSDDDAASTTAEFVELLQRDDVDDRRAGRPAAGRTRRGVSGAEDVRFPAGRDGAELHGIVAGSGTSGIVLAHESQQDAVRLGILRPHAGRRWTAGAGVRLRRERHVRHADRRAPRPRRAGGCCRAASPRGHHSCGDRASKGGTGVVGAAARPDAGIDAVVGLSGPTSYMHTDAAATAPSVTVPALFVAAEDDDTAPEAAQALADACGCPDPQVLIVPGARHGADLLHVDSPDASRVTDAVLALVSQALSGTG